MLSSGEVAYLFSLVSSLLLQDLHREYPPSDKHLSGVGLKMESQHSLVVLHIYLDLQSRVSSQPHPDG